MLLSLEIKPNLQGMRSIISLTVVKHIYQHCNYTWYKLVLFCLHLFAHTSFALIIPETYSYVLEITWCIMILLAFKLWKHCLVFNLKNITHDTGNHAETTRVSFLFTSITSLTFIHVHGRINVVCIKT